MKSNYFNLKSLTMVVKMGLMLIMVMAIQGCGKEVSQESYNDSYDNLFTMRIDIDQFSQAVNVSKTRLIRMRYGLLKPDAELTDVMDELCKAYNEYNYDDVEDILSKKYVFDSTQNSLKDIDKNSLEDDYRTIVFARNAHFDKALVPDVTGLLNHDVEEYIDHKFAWYRFPINAWDYLFNKEKLQNRYESEFSEIISTKRIDNEIVTRFNIYGSLIKWEQEELFGRETDIPLLKGVLLDDAKNIVTSETTAKMINRASIDLTDTELSLIEMVGLALIVWLVFTWLSNGIANKYAEWVLDYDISRGWKYNIFAGISNFINFWYEAEEQRKLARAKRWINSIITIVFIVLTWIYVIKPSAKAEQSLMNQLATNIQNYMDKISLPTLEHFNRLIENLLN